jgi:HK97 family phage prohead protease
MIKKQKKATRILNCLVDWDIKHVSKDASGKMVIKGFANTSDRDRVGDVVLPSAFEKSLAEYLDNPVILFQHNWDKVIGKCIKAEIVSEGDQQGLYIEAEISGAKDVEEVKTKIAEGILKTFSIGYNELDAEYDEASGVNVVKELELLEISVVTIPCNPKAKFTTEVQEEKTEEKSAVDLDGLFDYLATALKDLGSLEDVDGQFLSELSDIYLKGGPGSGRKPGGGAGKPKPSSSRTSAEEGEDAAREDNARARDLEEYRAEGQRTRESLVVETSNGDKYGYDAMVRDIDNIRELEDEIPSTEGQDVLDAFDRFNSAGGKEPKKEEMQRISDMIGRYFNS